ncbi:MAG: hypothetical protein KA004_08545 [Verrucomicrobiales bacterium]|nr:hypothetical protein [Verrucomicrobiales bacterium]
MSAVNLSAIRFLLPLCILAGILTGCVHAPQPRNAAPHDSAALPHPPNHDYHGGRGRIYDAGFALGKRDREHSLNADYTRHSGEYAVRSESEFAAGYAAGYSGR